MKKKFLKTYLRIISIGGILAVAVGSILKCSMDNDAPPAEIIEAAEEASRQVPEQGPAPEMKRIEPADSTEDSAMQADMERQYFEALVKIADGGKAYALDADGKRSAKAFKTFEEYEKFIADNPQYPRNRYAYDADGKPFNVDFIPSPDGDGWQIRNKPQTDEPVPDVSFDIRPATNE